MTLPEAIIEKFGITDSWSDASNVKWFSTGGVDVRELAKFMCEAEARFITITANQLPREEGFCLEYLWDFEGQIYGFAFYLSGNQMQSIYDICEAADWIEREIHEQYAIDFTGRVYEPLLLRNDDKPGVNLREHEVVK